MGLGSLLFALPHFLTEAYSPATTTSSASAGGERQQHRNVALCNMSLSCGIEEAVRDREFLPGTGTRQ